MYVRMAKEAREEGFTEIAAKFEMVGKIEKTHEERYRKLLKNVQDKVVFSRDGDCVWQCSNCGHIVVGRPDDLPRVRTPPELFRDPQGKLLSENRLVQRKGRRIFPAVFFCLYIKCSQRKVPVFQSLRAKRSNPFGKDSPRLHRRPASQ